MRKLSIVLVALLIAIPAYSSSRAKNVLKSLILPGYGQISTGHKYGYGMLASEIAIIGGLYYLNNEHDLSKQEYYEYALEYAHINPGSYSNQYFSDLSRYDSSGFGAGGYNAAIRQQAIQLYPNDPQQQQIYIDANIYHPDMSWQWDDLSHRRNYSQIRIKTQDYRDFIGIGTGVLIVNHLISTIDMLRYPTGGGMNLSAKVTSDKRMLFINIPF